jgi:multiple sugar transport system permease protein
MAELDNKSGFGSRHAQSPLLTGAAHLILLAAGALFILPLLWMASTSLKPLDQTMTTPPTWIPRANFAMLNGSDTIVEKKEHLKEERLIVIPQDGHEKGKQKLIARKEIDADGKALMKFPQSGREVYEDAPVPVKIVKECPAGYWLIQTWTPEFSSEREKANTVLPWDCVSESELRSAPHFFSANYSSALERMRDKSSDQAESEQAWYSSGFPRYVLNTLRVCFLSVIGSVVACTLVAYAFAFLEFPGRSILFALTLGVMMIPFPALMVPLYNLFHSLGWIGTYKPLWAPAWFGGAFYIFLLRQFFLGLPKDLLDAARIDGCSELEILWHVVVPLARPALAMVALFQFIGAWKDFMGPMVYLQDSHQFTLSLGLQAFFSQQGSTPWHYAMAAGMMFSLPLIVLFLLARKTFMRGIAMTGMKG